LGIKPESNVSATDTLSIRYKLIDEAKLNKNCKIKELAVNS